MLARGRHAAAGMMVSVGPIGSKLFGVLGNPQRQIMRTLHRALAIPWTAQPKLPTNGNPVRQPTCGEGCLPSVWPGRPSHVGLASAEGLGIIDCCPVR